MERKAHVVLVPSPAQGHINSMLQLARLLHSRGNIHISFVHTLTNYNHILASSGPSSLNGLDGFRFETIDDGSGLSDPVSGEELSGMCDVVRSRLSGPFRKLLMELNERESVPKVTCVVSDTYSSYTLEIAAEFGVPDVSFCSVGACGFWAFFLFKELVDTGVLPLKSESDLTNGYLDTQVNWIPGKRMRLKHFPSFVRTTNPNDTLLNFCKDESQDAKRATAFIINTLEELESPVLNAMRSILPPVYAVGPLNLLCHSIQNHSFESTSSNLWKEDDSCITWLNQRENNSVMYVNFGSLTVMNRQQLMEFAWGIANSHHDFLWVIRPNVVDGKDSGNLPEEFLLETKERGFVTSWCPQEKVLAHPAVGGFLTHCGWNSAIQSISNGVPVLCWPYFGDQQINCWYLCEEWRVGLEISNDVNRNDMERMIKELLGGDEGKVLRNNALQLKEKAVKATQLDGASFSSLDRVIDDVILQKKE